MNPPTEKHVQHVIARIEEYRLYERRAELLDSKCEWKQRETARQGFCYPDEFPMQSEIIEVSRQIKAMEGVQHA